MVGACLALVAWQLVLLQRLLELRRWQQLGQLGLVRRPLGQRRLGRLLGRRLRRLVGRPGSSLASFP